MKKIEHVEAYKKQTVQYIKESGKSVAEIGREFKDSMPIRYMVG